MLNIFGVEGIISLKYHWNISEISLRYHWDIIEISLKYHWNIIEISLRYHWDIIDISLRYHWDIIEISLTYHWNIIEISLRYHWNIIEISLKYHWNIIEISLKYHWNIIEISLRYHWNIIEISLKYHWNIIEISLKYHWNIIKYPPCSLGSQGFPVGFRPVDLITQRGSGHRIGHHCRRCHGPRRWNPAESQEIGGCAPGGSSRILPPETEIPLFRVPNSTSIHRTSDKIKYDQSKCTTKCLATGSPHNDGQHSNDLQTHVAF